MWLGKNSKTPSAKMGFSNRSLANGAADSGDRTSGMVGAAAIPADLGYGLAAIIALSDGRAAFAARTLTRPRILPIPGDSTPLGERFVAHAVHPI